jgi:hypothetical protein
MRKAILAIFAIIPALNLSAQCNELFISEYVEGTRNNKALEIYNPSGGSIDLSQYRVTRWQNGSAVWTSQYSDVLSGSIGQNEVRVLVIDRRDTTQTGQDTPVVLKLRLKADLWLSKDYNTSFAMSFNGDDALSLDKYDGVAKVWKPVDIFGRIGEQPQLASNPSRTIGWSDSFPYNKGLGKWWTIDQTMIRKASVTGGVDSNLFYFNPKSEWVLYPTNMFDSLGTHICDCNKFPASVKKTAVEVLNIYPNPARGTAVAFLPYRDAEVKLTDLQGRAVQADFNIEMVNGFALLKLNTTSLTAGIYNLNIKGSNGSSSGRLIIE